MPPGITLLEDMSSLHMDEIGKNGLRACIGKILMQY
jgi:hypothetical protein